MWASLRSAPRLGGRAQRPQLRLRLIPQLLLQHLFRQQHYHY